VPSRRFFVIFLLSGISPTCAPFFRLRNNLLQQCSSIVWLCSCWWPCFALCSILCSISPSSPHHPSVQPTPSPPPTHLPPAFLTPEGKDMRSMVKMSKLWMIMSAGVLSVSLVIFIVWSIVACFRGYCFGLFCCCCCSSDSEWGGEHAILLKDKQHGMLLSDDYDA
jgi:hypothetical protein